MAGPAFFWLEGYLKPPVYICIIVFLIWVGKSAYQFGYDVFNQQAMSPGEGQQVTVVIKEGASAYKVGKTLEQKGLIKDALAFTIQERMSAYHGQIKAGTYLLSTAYTPTRIHGGAVRRRERGRIEQPVIVEERMQTYINSLDMGNTPFLQELEDKGTCRLGADHPKRYAEFYEDASGGETAEAHFGGGDCRRLLHTSYV